MAKTMETTTRPPLQDDERILPTEILCCVCPEVALKRVVCIGMKVTSSSPAAISAHIGVPALMRCVLEPFSVLQQLHELAIPCAARIKTTPDGLCC